MSAPGEIRDGAAGEPAPDPAQAPVIRSAGITLVGSAVGGLMVIVGEVIAARLLQVQAYGLYASGMTVARIGEATSVFGLPVGIFHYVPVYRQKGQAALVVGTVYAAALLPMLLGIAFAVATWLLAPWIARYVFNGADVVEYIRLLALAVPFMASCEVLGAITRGFGYAKYYVIVKNLIPPAVFLTALGLMAGLRADPIWITGGVAAASGLACLAGIAAVVRVAGPDLWRVRPDFRFATLYRYAAGIMASTFLYMVYALTGILAVAVFLGSDAVGIYRVCLQVVVPFDMVLLAFHAAMGPVYPVLARENRQAELEEAYGTAVRWMMLLLLPLGVVLAWNRVDFLALLGPEFVAGATALLILAAGYALCTCFGTVAYLLMLSGRKGVETANAAFATAANVVLAIVLVPRYGLTGAAIATALSFLALNALRVWEARRILAMRTFRPRFLRVVAVSLGSAFAIFALLEWLGIAQGRDAPSVALRVALMLGLHALVLWGGGLGAQDKEVVRSLLRFAGGRGRGHPAA